MLSVVGVLRQSETLRDFVGIDFRYLMNFEHPILLDITDSQYYSIFQIFHNITEFAGVGECDCVSPPSSDSNTHSLPKSCPCSVQDLELQVTLSRNSHFDSKA